jgi:DNA primase large subunit
MAVHRAPDRLDERSLFAEYPFLAGAESLLGGETVSVGNLVRDAAFERVRAIGRARILAAVDDPRGAPVVQELHGASGEVRYLSFLFARLVLSAAPSAAPLRRWAVAEAKRGHGRLGSAPRDELLEVARRLGFAFEDAPDGIAVPLVEYLRLAVPIREAEFRLARQDVRDGRVVVAPMRAARLLQEAVRLRLAVPIPEREEVVRALREREADLLAEVARRTPLPVARLGAPGAAIHREWFPPCVRKMLRALEAGENLSHAGRFALAAFLHRVGADFETIVDAYRGAPDFDESITRYQVEHITLRDGGKGYAVPECDTLRSHGLCARDGDPTAPQELDRARDPRCFDPRLRHPLQYYRWRGGLEVARGDDDATGAGGAPGTPSGPARSPSTGPR